MGVVGSFKGTNYLENEMKQQKRHIVWDLSGTLFKPSSQGLTKQEKNDLSLLFYMWSGKKIPSDLDIFALKLLDAASKPTPECDVLRLHTGEPVPSIICLWLCGLISSADVLKKIKQNAREVSTGELSSQEIQQVYRCIEAFFTPDILARCMQPIPETTRLVHLCAQNKENIPYVLSNWDKESFIPFYALQEKQEPFSLIPRKNIFISADIGYIKPQPEIYQFFLYEFNLDPATCLFIDDQQENLVAAKQAGIDGIRFTQDDSQALECKLRQLLIIR